MPIESIVVIRNPKRFIFKPIEVNMMAVVNPDRHKVCICNMLKFSSIIATNKRTRGSCCIIEMTVKGVLPKNDNMAK